MANNNSTEIQIRMLLEERFKQTQELIGDLFPKGYGWTLVLIVPVPQMDNAGMPVLMGNMTDVATLSVLRMVIAGIEERRGT